MLKEAKLRKQDGRGLVVAIVASRYNARFVDGLRRAAVGVLSDAGAAVEEVRVPGSFEIPVAAAALARRGEGRPDAIVCLGVIWQGATTHAQQIGEAVTSALMALQLETGVPCVHEVLTLASEDQARERCLDPGTNRGLEAAGTALEMGRLLRRLRAGTAGSKAIKRQEKR
ncbi:MAG: 6,7-dimethyl-8-ribityllumazine synthase [Verrucomicrobia bacterium]|nr:MAG: 6,7-dimethyl-8-ribityllumazine synthase [Verrucomicrobiota bacterium]